MLFEPIHEASHFSSIPISMTSYYLFSSFSLESDLNSQTTRKDSLVSSGTGGQSGDSAYGSGVNRGVASPGGLTPSAGGQQQPDSTDIFYLSSLIARRARGLLTHNEIHELFLMASHIGFNVTSWLKRERLNLYSLIFCL